MTKTIRKLKQSLFQTCRILSIDLVFVQFDCNVEQYLEKNLLFAFVYTNQLI
jgi:hypothetical protein